MRTTVQSAAHSLIESLRTEFAEQLGDLHELQRSLGGASQQILLTSAVSRNTFFYLAETCIALRRLSRDLRRGSEIICPLDFSELYDWGHGSQSRKGQLTPLLTHVVEETALPLAVLPASLHEMAAFLRTRAKRVRALGFRSRWALRSQCKAYLSALRAGDTRSIPSAAERLVREVMLLDRSSRLAWLSLPAERLLTLLASERLYPISGELNRALPLYQSEEIGAAYDRAYEDLTKVRQDTMWANRADAQNLADTLALNELEPTKRYYALITRAYTLRVCDRIRWHRDLSPVSRSAQYLYFLSQASQDTARAELVAGFHDAHLELLKEAVRVLTLGAKAPEAERVLGDSAGALQSLLGNDLVGRAFDATKDALGQHVVNKYDVERVLVLLDNSEVFGRVVDESREELRGLGRRILDVGQRFSSVFDQAGLNPDYQALCEWASGAAE